MELEPDDDVRRICVDRLGDRKPTGRCRLGGPALLEPDTAWPEFDGVPLSLHAVIDTDQLSPWPAGEGPDRSPGLLNFFHLDPDLPYESVKDLESSAPAACRVVPADPARAVERPAPHPTRSYPGRAVHAAPVTTLPDCWDLPDDAVAYDPDAHWGAASLLLDAFGDLDGNNSGGHQAFGWPGLSHTVPVMGFQDAEPHMRCC
ncbi:DUF1963 domain-containing protein [Streptomyces atriruber]|uniref:DUF1963 domain-containing protein n=1 Tax=Streptomyces atriruber TaxID=545121 RepID=A0ABV3BJ52_9ACTN